GVVDAVPGPPSTAGAAVVAAARAVRAVVVIGERATAHTAAAAVGPGLRDARQPGRAGGDPDADLARTCQKPAASRLRHVGLAYFFEPFVERHLAPPVVRAETRGTSDRSVSLEGPSASSSCWSWCAFWMVAPSMRVPSRTTTAAGRRATPSASP